MISITEAKSIASYDERVKYLGEALADYEIADLCQIISNINSYDSYFEELETYDIFELYDLMEADAFIRGIIFGEVTTALDYVMIDDNGVFQSITNDDAMEKIYDSVADIAEYIIDSLNTGAEVDMLLFYEVDKEILEAWKSSDNED